MDVKNKITTTYGKAKLTVKRWSPEILLAAGIISGGAALIFAVKETLKAETVIEHHEDRMAKIEQALLVSEEVDDVEYTVEDSKKDTVKAYVKTGCEFAKLYAPTIIFTTLSLSFILTSHGIMRKRNVALAATLATVRTAFDEYRGRVIRDLGEEQDQHFLYDTVTKERIDEVETEDGKTKKVKTKYQVPTKINAYSRFFDESNENFEKNGWSNYTFLRCQMIGLRNKLISQGYLFLNDVYKALDFPLTQAGQQAGWIYDFDNAENTELLFEGFGLDEHTNSQAVMDLMNGYERTIMLTFKNVRDDILTDLPRVVPEFDTI